MIPENEERLKLKSITLSGFKSFDSREHVINFGDITVLIGANGAGKSNVVSFFKMLTNMVHGFMDQYAAEQNGNYGLLHFGPKKTFSIVGVVSAANNEDSFTYVFHLDSASNDTLAFIEETISNAETGRIDITKGKRSSALAIPTENESILKVKDMLMKCWVYHLHDTSPVSRLRSNSYINDNLVLKLDAGNLPAYLYTLKQRNDWRYSYTKILRHIQNVFPQFGDFVLNPSPLNENNIILNWTEKDRPDYLFGPHQLSDGTLRFMALATLLLQPAERMPAVIVIDEPELGLHPAAINELAAMVKSASRYAQIVLATQSPALLDAFEPEQVVVVERDPETKSSIFKSFSSGQLSEWLKEYTLSEIWDKNILGGQP